MATNNFTADSSRLSLALVDLPLTPFGMKSPSPCQKKKIFNSCGNSQKKGSRLRLKPTSEDMQGLPLLPSSWNKENVELRANLPFANITRRRKNLRTQLNSAPIDKGRNSEIVNLEVQRLEKRRDSVFTDIDDGSFIEFVNKKNDYLPSEPAVKTPASLFYYTCSENNETEYTTSSKMPLCPVGFHKFINPFNNKDQLGTIEESYIEVQPNKFKYDETVIAGSRDICLKAINDVHLNIKLNSTEYSHCVSDRNYLPDISSLTISNKEVEVESPLHSQHLKKNAEVECIILSETDDESVADECVKNQYFANRFQQFVNLEKKSSSYNPDESLISEDVSIVSVPPRNEGNDKGQELALDPVPNIEHYSKRNWKNNGYVSESEDGDDCRNEKGKEHSLIDESEFEKEGNIREENNQDDEVPETNNFEENELQVYCVPNVDKRVVGWVMTSPFKESSFGTSFLDKDKNVRHLQGSKTTHLYPRLSEESFNLEPSIFTVGRVAESPESENIALETPNNSIGREKDKGDVSAHMVGQVDRLIYSSDECSEYDLPTPKSYSNSLQRKKSSTQLLKQDHFKDSSITDVICSSSEEESKKDSVRKHFRNFFSSDSLNRSQRKHTFRNVKSGKPLDRRKSKSCDNSSIEVSSDDESSKTCAKKFLFNDKKCSFTNSNKSDKSIFEDGPNPPSVEGKDFASIPTSAKYPSSYDLKTNNFNHSSSLRRDDDLKESSLQLHLTGVDSTSSKEDDPLPSRKNEKSSLPTKHPINSLNKKSLSPTQIHDNSAKKTSFKLSLSSSNSSLDLALSGDKNVFAKLRKQVHKLLNSSTNQKHSCVEETAEKKITNCRISPKGRSVNSDNPASKNFTVKSRSEGSEICSSTSSSSADDSFNNYIQSCKRTQSTRRRIKKCSREKKYASSSDESSDNLSDSSLPTGISKKSSKKIISKGTSHTPNSNKWRNIPKLIISSSSDSEDNSFPFKTPKRTKPKKPTITVRRTPKPKSASTSNLSSKPLSFIGSLGVGVDERRAHPEAVLYIKNFKKFKENLTTKLYETFNKSVFSNQLPSVMNVKWNSRMTKTAGYCYYQMDRTKPSGRGARIELSSKVIDAPGRLRDTLIHELCHAASWIINGYKDGHGPLWKSWASKAIKTFPELPPINRCHSYEISCKYTYRCSKCGYSIGRHSKSLDTEKKVCGYCYSKFELLVNYASKNNQQLSNTPKETPKTPRTPNPFAMYVKENYGSIKRSKKHLKHGDIMKALSEEFSKLKTNV